MSTVCNNTRQSLYSTSYISYQAGSLWSEWNVNAIVCRWILECTGGKGEKKGKVKSVQPRRQMGVGCQHHVPPTPPLEKDPVTTVQKTGWDWGRAGRVREISPSNRVSALTFQPVGILNSDDTETTAWIPGWPILRRVLQDRVRQTTKNKASRNSK